MNKMISFLANTGINQNQRHTTPATSSPQKTSSSFGKIIAESNAVRIKKATAGERRNNEKTKPIFIGQISQKHPTVSQLMLENKQLGNKSWNIINAQINRNKPYTKVREGTQVFLNPANNELLLGHKEVAPLTKSKEAAVISPQQGKGREVTIGSLGKDTPTISHLLAASEEFNNSKWQILSSPVNAHKDFRHIPAGTPIRINTQTKEISWGAAPAPRSALIAADKKSTTNKNGSEKAENLSTAVQEFIGTPYSKLDCYELVVKGLKNIGVQYGGKDGLYNRLTDMAKTKGLPANAYLTGEGLIKAAGSRLLYEAFPSVTQPDLTAKQTLEKMSKILEPGQILSFSTPTRGHTGIISRQPDGEWTFINSGKMDHPVQKMRTGKGVGEEALLAELTNWFELANRRKESLTVTLGKIDQNKIQRTYGTPSGTLLASI